MSARPARGQTQKAAAVIETRGLVHGYEAAASLRFADVSVPQGGTLLLRGPSGSGKSTWLALAAGLLTRVGRWRR